MATTSIRGLISEVSKADPQSWLSFFKRFNISPDDVNLENELRRAYQKYGREFSAELNKLLIKNSPRIAAVTGEDVRSVVDSVFDILGIDSKAPAVTPEEKAKQKAEAEKAEQEEKEKAEKRKKTIIIGFVGLAVVVIATFIIIKIVKK